MKKRLGFVSNSSSSSFVCDLCGRSESGWDGTPEEVDMVECKNGHIICQNEAYLDNFEFTEEEQIHYEDSLQYPERICPICLFELSSKTDMAKYLERMYGVSRDEIFKEIKKLNPRRKKLYDREYVEAIYNRYKLNEIDLLKELKEQFGTYKKFMEALQEIK